MGGFFLVCAGPQEDRRDKIARLQEAFADLGFSAPQFVKTDGYVLAAYPKFQNASAELKRYPDEDFALVCGTCLFDGVGLAPPASLYERAATRAGNNEEVM